MDVVFAGVEPVDGLCPVCFFARVVVVRLLVSRAEGGLDREVAHFRCRDCGRVDEVLG